MAKAYPPHGVYAKGMAGMCVHMKKGRRGTKNPCRGICEDMDGIVLHGTNMHKDGRKYCSTCRKSFFSDKLHCPCCRRMFRRVPKNSRGQSGDVPTTPADTTSV